MRFNNWRFSDAATYVTTKKSMKLHPLRAPSGFSSIAFQAAMMAQQEIEPRDEVPQPATPNDSSFLQQPPEIPQPRAGLGN